MEHLIGASERQNRQAEIDNAPSVPWLGFQHRTDGQPLVSIEDYPLRRGWTREALRQLESGHLGNRSSREALAMLQSWMSFGLLEAAFMTTFQVADFLQSDSNGKKTVQTSYLRDWIDDFHSKVHNFPSPNDAGVMQRRERLVRSVERAAFWNQRLFEIEKEGETRWTNSDLFGPVTRLFTLIAEAVWAVGQRLPSLESRPFIPCEWVIMEVNDRDLRGRVARRGWCVSMYDKIKDLSRTPSSVLEYISLVSPFREARNQHRDCSIDGCVEYNIKESEYPTEHRVHGCRCERVMAPLQAVKEALLAGTIPIIDGISLTSQDSENAVYTFIPGGGQGDSVKYVAISHVWSDGLGSTTERGMLQCQVEYLLQLALEIGGTPLIWIDSLCIPQDKEPRKLAISMMAETYGAAHRTIVLDSGIAKCDLGLSLETKLLALSLSAWQERLWTLQESSLSREVEFVFRDEVASAWNLLTENSQQIHRPINRMFHLLLDNLTYWVHNNQVTMGGLQRNLYRRTSSKPDDESLAVAPFLNINVLPLLQVDGEERMMLFWKEARNLPKAIVIHNAQKLSRDGFRWAPRSIMNQKGSIVMDFQDRSAVVVDGGLKGNFWIYSLEMRTTISLDQEAEILIYETRADCLLRILPFQTTTQLTLSSDHVIVFADKLFASIERFLGAILRRVADQSMDQSAVPTYRFEGLVGANVVSKADSDKIAGESNQLWQAVVNSTQGRTIGQWADVVIC